MGLDLYHEIVVYPSAENNNNFDLDFFNDPAFIQQNRHLIGEVTEADKSFSILVFSGYTAMLRYCEYYSESKNVMLVGSLKSLKKEIHEIEVQHNLDTSKISISQTKLKMPSGNFVVYSNLTYPISYSTFEVLYLEKIGYQRKRMNSRFYEDFNNYYIYTKKEDVLRAAEYLDLTGTADENTSLIAHFHSNFIDNFEEGKSIFLASW